MGAPKGHKKWGGRQKGSPNKVNQTIREKLTELNCDPVLVLAHFTNADWKKLNYPAERYTEEKAGGVVNEVLFIQPETRVNAAKELMKYVYPQLKAIEHTGADGGPIKVEELTTEERKARLSELLQRAKTIEPK